MKLASSLLHPAQTGNELHPEAGSQANQKHNIMLVFGGLFIW